MCKLNEYKTNKKRGIALVAVLAILVVLSILASTMVVMMNIERKSATTSMQNQTLDLLADSAVEHAIAVLSVSGPNKIDQIDILNDNFRAKNPNQWINVHDSTGILIGRYRIKAEDEAGKVNLNTAWLLHPSKGSGWNPGEINFPKALGLKVSNARKLLDFRYGPNKLPGTRTDDDRNNPILSTDGIDNNSNGIIDEKDEGINDPGEYDAKFLRGDDRAFISINEVTLVLKKILKKNFSREALKNALKRIATRATIYSVDYPGSQTLPNDYPSDINAMTARQCRKRLRAANAEYSFEKSTKDLDALAANIVDYRDENHVLSTVGSRYGVEQICFNELLANDGTQSRPTFSKMMTSGTGTVFDDSKDAIVENSCLFRYRNWSLDMVNPGYYLNKNKWKYIDDSNPAYAKKAWDIEIKSNGKQIQLLGPAQNSSGKLMWDRNDIKSWEHFREVQQSIGKYGKITLHGDAGFGKKISYASIKWPQNFFKNQYLSVGFTDPAREKLPSWYKSKELPPKNKQAIKIIKSSVNGLLTLEKSVGSTNGLISRCILWNWGGGTAPNCVIPNCTTRITVQKLEPGKYYLPTVSCIWNANENISLAFGPFDNIGKFREPYRHRLDYGGDGRDALPIRSGKKGGMNVYVRSDSKTSSDKWPALHGLTFMRPEVIELINIGTKPVSLKGWKLMFNSGSVANNIGEINTAQGYELNRSRPDINPTIMPNKYFYFVNNIKLFNCEFGSGNPDNSWGKSADQKFPVWEIPNDSWGVQYKIKKAVKDPLSNINGYGRMPRIYVQSANFRKNQFKGETLEFVDSKHQNGTDQRFDGTRWRVVYNGKNFFTVATGSDWPSHLKRLQPPNCDRVMLLGMPAKGGIVSMTLKNEYQQITARTIEYSYMDKDPDLWYGYSTEKVDPSGYNWEIQKNPSIGGQTFIAKNRSLRRRKTVMPKIKNVPFVSVGETKNVSTRKDFENVGNGRSKGGAKRTIAALANVLCSSVIKLNANDEDTLRTGWESAQATAESVRNGIVTAKNANWEKDQWKGQTLRFMTGEMRGESFPIFGNSKRRILLKDANNSQKPRSTPSLKSLSARKGDIFSLGPGYRTPMCYTRRENNKGEWTWKKKIPVKGKYDLYLFGLNDAINTTEFLEENNNAPLDIEVWNYSSKSYDMLCKKKSYNKADEIYAGKILPEHISNEGDFKLRLTPHQLTSSSANKNKIGDVAPNKQKTGFAWFDYAVITPVPVPGRVNVNTASKRLLSCLPGVGDELAKNIEAGVGDNKSVSLKPYKKIGDLLYVRGMSLDIFERIANLVCVSSSAYTLNIDLQVVEDRDEDGKFNKKTGDKILGEKHKRVIITRKEGSADKTDFRVAEQY